MTPDLHLAVVVDSILVSGKIVGPREDRIARLASARVDALAFVRPSLRVALCDRLRMRGRMLPVTFALVLLQFLRSLESEGAAMVRASVGACIGRCICRSCRRLRL